MLLLSGNIELNPGPDINCQESPSDFKSRSGLGVIHLNVRSILPKLDLVKIWTKWTHGLNGHCDICQTEISSYCPFVSPSRQFEFPALKLELLKGHFITVVSCYRPPSAISETL